jgi:hypothetical protein
MHLTKCSEATILLAPGKKLNTKGDVAVPSIVLSYPELRSFHARRKKGRRRQHAGSL